MNATARLNAELDALVFPGATLGHTEPVSPSPGGFRYEAFAQHYVRQSKGRWRGKRLNFYPEQRGFNHALFATDAGGERLYREALKGVARKNGKSTDSAALALYLLLADGEPAPEVYGAAGSREQAKIILTEAKRMVHASPALSEWCKVYRNEIVVPSIDGVFRAVSADAGLQMGSNPNGVVADELHVWRGDAGRELYYALSTGMDARQAPLFVSITTAGYDTDTICYDVFERGARGDEQDFLMYWIGALEGEDIADPAVWMRANPAPWITEQRMRRNFHRLPASVFARLHLNLWTATEDFWLPQDAWAKCRDRAVEIEDGERVWLGVDIGYTRDHSAVVEVARRENVLTLDENGEPVRKTVYPVNAYIFKPAEHGGKLDLSPVENKIKELVRKRRVRSVSYDRTLFHKSAEELSELVRMEDVPWASNQRIVEGSQRVYGLIVDRLFRHSGDKTFGQHVHNATVRETESGFRISKHKSKKQIDALAALVMAVIGMDADSGVEPGARPIATGSPPKDLARLQAVRRRAVEQLSKGGVVECSTGDYIAAVRDGLQEYAGRMLEDGEELRARAALAEVQRLDAVHAFGVS